MSLPELRTRELEVFRLETEPDREKSKNSAGGTDMVLGSYHPWEPEKRHMYGSPWLEYCPMMNLYGVQISDMCQLNWLGICFEPDLCRPDKREC